MDYETKLLNLKNKRAKAKLPEQGTKMKTMRKDADEFKKNQAEFMAKRKGKK